MSKLLSCILFVCLAGAVAADDLAPFTTDGCSDFPDGTPSQQSLWLDCCIRHDLAYWKGGTREERLAADQALRQCVAQTGEPKIADIMLAGVRMGGSPYFPTSYRWGYGWPYRRGYQPLNDTEKEQVRRQLKRLERMIKSLSDELDTQRR